MLEGFDVGWTRKKNLGPCVAVYLLLLRKVPRYVEVEAMTTHQAKRSQCTDPT